MIFCLPNLLYHEKLYAMPFLKEKIYVNKKRLVSVLQDHNTHIITPPDPELLGNVNTPEDYQAARRRLSPIK